MSDQTFHVLVADDEEGLRFVLGELLANLGYQMTEAEDGEQALEIIRTRKLDLAILDINMPKIDGMDVLKEARALHPDLIVLVVTAYGSTEMAMRAIQLGAYDYFTKPFDVHDLRTTIQRALEKKQLLDQIHVLETKVSGQPQFREIIGSSDAIQEIFDMMQRVVDNDVPVLITGESGTGKGLVLKAIHDRGSRKNGPLVRVNCAAIPEALLESELFGHEKGSFTGATASHSGKFEQAHGGTLFLDEIGDMPLTLQAKILVAVQESEIQRVGGKEPIQVNVRLITATNRNLAEEVAAKRFREDLYFRINVITIEMPPLRERLSDIPLLVDYFIKIYNERLKKKIQGLSQEVMDTFLNFPWPGNIRELENIIQRSLIMAAGPNINKGDLPPNMLSPAADAPGPARPTAPGKPGMTMPEKVEEVIETTERSMIAETLSQCRGRQEAAQRLGISRKSLHNKMQKYGITG